MKARKRGKYNRRKRESQKEEFLRNIHEYREKMSGNAYLQTDVWIVFFGDLEQDNIQVLGFEPDNKDYTLLLAYSSRAKAEAYVRRENHLKSEPVMGGEVTVDKMPLAALAVLAMTGPVRNIAIDKSGDTYSMLNVIKMKTSFDAGLTLDG